ncbi:MAG: hypothetical protein HS111_10405 [Kofleriaceae bacterium]|nr:hypothetical protein [Kofleriaceae bacterium]
MVKRIAQYEVVEAGGRRSCRRRRRRRCSPRRCCTSTVAHLLTSKFGLGVPHYRLERDLLDQACGSTAG